MTDIVTAHGYSASLLASDSEGKPGDCRGLSCSRCRWKYTRRSTYRMVDHEVSHYQDTIALPEFRLTMPRKRRYKLPIILASKNSMVAFVSLIFSWRGHSSPADSLLIFSGGFGTGMAHSAIFVYLNNSIANEDMAIASSGFYLSTNIGGMVGVSLASAVSQIILQKGLLNALKEYPNKSEVSALLLRLEYWLTRL